MLRSFWILGCHFWRLTDEDLKMACWRFEDCLRFSGLIKNSLILCCESFRYLKVIKVEVLSGKWIYTKNKTVDFEESLITFEMNDQNCFARKSRIKCMYFLLLDAVLYAVTDMWCSNENLPAVKVTCDSEKVHSRKSVRNIFLHSEVVSFRMSVFKFIELSFRT